MFKVRSAVVHAALTATGLNDKFIYVDANTRFQILETMMFLDTTIPSAATLRTASSSSSDPRRRRCNAHLTSPHPNLLLTSCRSSAWQSGLSRNCTRTPNTFWLSSPVRTRLSTTTFRTSQPRCWSTKNKIGWVAHPKHEDAAYGFKHAGRFKKASDMIFGLALSLSAETYLAAQVDAATSTTTREGRGRMAAMAPAEHAEVWEDLAEKALLVAIEEVWATNGREGGRRVEEVVSTAGSDSAWLQRNRMEN
ncbi:hypothetical protein NEOLEDRAFT_1246446 [Neolentinus lepideus HHB14362 ss-1]|uniref:Uncharacterized protein n=1 Tax=Neolentinus lepideus HHB14362 ss-1 TaxID=1314782 RepID=A0A165MJQ3_9AGAM|nr:hypothetical protein NEOLEDRAFT_1246446 [Neolentinus lepideus HHB14362 ss-1]